MRTSFYTFSFQVISMAELEELNESLDVKVTDKTELDMFLQFQHDSGEIIWFRYSVLPSNYCFRESFTDP